MNQNPTALIELAEKIEQLAQFQDKIEIPAGIHRIWEAFLRDARGLIEIESCALFMVDETSQEFVFTHAAPEARREVFQKEIEAQIEVGIFSVVLKRRQPSITPALGSSQGLSAVMLPLATVKRTLGMVLAQTPLQESLVTQENMRLLSVLAGSARWSWRTRFSTRSCAKTGRPSSRPTKKSSTCPSATPSPVASTAAT